MTSGYKEIGSSSTGPTYFTKSWSGVDGKYGGSAIKENPYICEIVTETRVPGSSGVYFCGARFTYPDYHPSGNSGLAMNGRLLDKVRGHSLNLGVSLAEGKRTINLATSTIGSLALGLRDLHRGDFASAARRLSVKKNSSRLRATDISGRWLELQYGWKPLLSDVYEGARAFHARNSPSIQQVFTASSPIEPYYFSNSSIDSKWSAVMKLSSRTKLVISSLPSFERTLGLYDPLSIAWELTPWSFVFDWFLPFGTYLEQLNQLPAVKGQYVVTERKTIEQEFRALPELYPGGPPNPHYPAYSKYNLKGITRSVSTDNFPPLPSFKPLPKVFSLGHIENAIALAHQVISGSSVGRGYSRR